MPSIFTHFRVEDLHGALKAPAVAGAIYHSDDKIRDQWVIAISHAMVAASFHSAQKLWSCVLRRSSCSRRSEPSPSATGCSSCSINRDRRVACDRPLSPLLLGRSLFIQLMADCVRVQSITAHAHSVWTLFGAKGAGAAMTATIGGR